MQSDSATLLRMIVHTQTEASLLGFSEAARCLWEAADHVARSMHHHPELKLSDDIFDVVSRLAEAKSIKR